MNSTTTTTQYTTSGPHGSTTHTERHTQGGSSYGYDMTRSASGGFGSGLAAAAGNALAKVTGGGSKGSASHHHQSYGHGSSHHGSSIAVGHGSAHGSSVGHGSGHGMAIATPTSPGSGRIISTVRGEERFTGETHVVNVRQGEARYTGETRVVDHRMSAAHATGETRVVGHEKGHERQVSVTEVAVGEEIIGQTDHKIGRGKRGKKIIREEVIEKVIVVPETIQIEEWVEDEYDMEETVVEVAKKFQIEKIVEVPEIEIVEKIIEQVETVIKEKIVEVPKIETVEKIVEVPVIQTVEVIVEVPEIQYNDIPVERIVEIPEVKNEDVICERKSCNFVDKPVEQIKLVADASSQNRKLPVPVEAETIVEFTVAAIRANYVKKKFPVYLPRFIEVPVSRQFVSAGVVSENQRYTSRIANLTNCAPGGAVSLAEIEKVAAEYKTFEMSNQITQKKANLGNLSRQEKEAMYQAKQINLEQYALYKNLPIEVSNLVFGKINFSGLGSAMTYSSATFGSASLSSTTHHSSSNYAIGGSTTHSSSGMHALRR